MIELAASLRTWKTLAFAGVLRDEFAALPNGSLPLDKGISQGGFVDDSNLAVSVFNSSEQAGSIEVDIGVFFIEIVASCGCGDEPMPVNAYCEMRVRIDKASGQAEFTISDA